MSGRLRPDALMVAPALLLVGVLFIVPLVRLAGLSFGEAAFSLSA